RFRPAPRAVLNQHPEAASGADAAHGWRSDDENEAFLNCGQLLQEGKLDRRTRLPRVLRSFREWLECDEDGARVGSIGEGGAGKADEVDRVGYPGHLQGHVHDAAIDFIGSRQRSASWQLCHDYEVALVDLRDEAN